jgi:chemotaxis regulatin CheY-phosphate phosphatase CheZ
MPVNARAELMPLPPAPMPLSEADYEAIEAAVLETNRGRWFLAEYARRNRHADTKMLLGAIDRLEAAIRGERTAESVDRIRFDLVEMAKAIVRTKSEIAAIKPDVEQAGKFGEATEELDSIVGATEAATSDILAAAEQIQEVAWTLREQGLDAEVCDLLDAKATAIYTACSFQDLTGQRTRKVIQVLRYLEGRINAMIDIWGLDATMAAEAAETARAREDEGAVVSSPARRGHGLDQADVDIVMGPAVAAVPTQIDGEAVEVAAKAPAPAPASRAAASASDPLAPLNALSPEEKIALFS